MNLYKKISLKFNIIQKLVTKVYIKIFCLEVKKSLIIYFIIFIYSNNIQMTTISIKLIIAHFDIKSSLKKNNIIVTNTN